MWLSKARDAWTRGCALSPHPTLSCPLVTLSAPILPYWARTFEWVCVEWCIWLTGFYLVQTRFLTCTWTAKRNLPTPTTICLPALVRVFFASHFLCATSLALLETSTVVIAIDVFLLLATCAAKRRRLDFDQICRWHGYIMVFYGISGKRVCISETLSGLRQYKLIQNKNGSVVLTLLRAILYNTCLFLNILLALKSALFAQLLIVFGRQRLSVVQLTWRAILSLCKYMFVSTVFLSCVIEQTAALRWLTAWVSQLLTQRPCFLSRMRARQMPSCSVIVSVYVSFCHSVVVSLQLIRIDVNFFWLFCFCVCAGVSARFTICWSRWPKPSCKCASAPLCKYPNYKFTCSLSFCHIIKLQKIRHDNVPNHSPHHHVRKCIYLIECMYLTECIYLIECIYWKWMHVPAWFICI